MIKHLLSQTVLCAVLLITPVLVTKLHACTGADITFTSVSFTSLNSGYTYSYQIKNIGTTAIPMNKIVIQNYVSTDNAVGQDVAAAGSFIDVNSTASLAAGATYSGTMWANPNTHSTSTHPYIIINVYLSSGTECDLTNNQYIGLIQITSTGTRSSAIADASVNWNNETKSFSVDHWQGNTKTLQYTVFNTSGGQLLSGSTEEEENTPLNGLKEGIYIIYLYDGEKVYSKKIMY